MKSLSILSLALFSIGAQAQTSVPNSTRDLVIPSGTTVQWAPGLEFRGGIPSRPTGSGAIFNAHTTYGADNTGGSDATAAIQNAINAAGAAASSANGCVAYLPTGTYLVSNTLILPSNVSLRGEGPTLSIIHYTGTSSNGCITADGDTGWAASKNITASAEAGATKITVSSSAGMAVGGIINISQTNPTSPFSFVDVIGNNGTYNIAGAPGTSGGAAFPNGNNNDPTRCLMQINRITAITGNVLTLERPLYLATGTNPYVNYQAGAFTTGVGIEDLQISCTGAGVNEPTILLSNCILSWVKNIACILSSASGGTQNSAHVYFYNSYANEVRDSWFQGGGVNTSGQDYGVACFPNVSECLCENNVFVGMRHSMITSGGSGNVYGYNYSVANIESPVNTFLAEDGSSHAAESFFNLWEGNICAQFDMDNTLGGNAWNTIYRSWSLAWSTAMSTTSPVNYRYAVVLDQNTYNANVVGNVYGQSGDVTALAAGRHNRGVSSDYLFNDPNNLSIPATGENFASYYIQGNYSFLLNSTDWIGGTVVTLPDSLYHSSKPSWWTSALPFPAIGPDCSPVNGSIPAETRYRAHSL
jgi:hypothetical protein